MSLTAPIVVGVSDRRRLAPGLDLDTQLQRLARWLCDMVDAGTDLLQVRERDLPAARLADVVRGAVEYAVKVRSRTRVLVNDRADVALAAGADGVHLPETGLPPGRIAAVIPGWIVGRSVHDAFDRRLVDGATYLIFGTVFATMSKGVEPSGIERLTRAVDRVSVPVVAIGGMTPERAEAAAAAGAAGVAGIGVFLPVGATPTALGPLDAVAALRDATRRGFEARTASRTKLLE